jgi:PAS domain S-box-containing protein
MKLKKTNFNNNNELQFVTDDILDHCSIGVFILDSNFKVVFINQAMEKFFGISVTEVINKDKRQLVVSQIKYFFADPQTYAEKVLATYANNTYSECFECHVLPSFARQERWFECKSFPIDFGIYKGGRIEFYFDITAQKLIQEKLQKKLETRAEELRELNRLLYKSKQRYRILSSMLPVGIFHLDTEGNCLYANKRFKEITGIDGAFAFVNGGWERVIHPDDLEYAKKTWFEATRNHIPFKAEYRFRGHDGSVHWVFAQAIEEKDNNGEVRSYIGTFTDITEQKKALAKNKLQKRQLEQIGHLTAMEEVVTGLAHQLNQPLTIISSYAQILREQLANVSCCLEIQNIADKVIKNAKRASEIMQKMRAFFGGGLLNKTQENINRIIVDTIQLLEDDTFNINCIELDFIKPDVILLLDKTQIEQVIVNLVHNAIEAVQAVKNTKPVICIKTYICENMLKVIVIDNGIGLLFETKEQIFEPFFTTKIHGMGMGLAICRSIIEAHDGQLFVEENSSNETRICFTLPMF